jgi:putative hemolysin
MTTASSAVGAHSPGSSVALHADVRAPDSSVAISSAVLADVFVVFLLIFAHGLFAGAEIAVVSLRRTRLRQLVEGGSGLARAVESLRNNPERFLATVQVGITVIGVATAALAVPTFRALALGPLRDVSILTPYAENIANVFAIAIVSYLELVLAELVPKSIALRTAETYSLIVGRPLRALSAAAKPAIWLLEGSSNVVLRIFGDRTTFMESRLSPEEITQALEEAGKHGALDGPSSEIAVRAIEMSGLTAADVMVPRNRVIALDRASAAEEVRRLFLESAHQRVPVYEENLDNVVGYVTSKDVLAVALERGPLSVDELLRPPTFYPEAMKAVSILRDMQKNHVNLAIVVDERGGMAGILTMEDLLEELVGEIFSEDDRGGPAPVRLRPDGSAWVLGTTPIREVNRALDVDLPEGELWATIAGYCIALAGHIPAPGERVVGEDGTILEILESTPRRIRTIRLLKPRPADGEEKTYE